ncbi:preprotein translocase subunit SecE [Neptunitalea lumnitzerae]|uniref:Protein translocase subunit SecE n=1 Tax=Neptunitalea lumnitzerae TaxID=2965509 RepID=A0ABQ5MPM3_9FLAO|nr:preprotein translocase subunit SecE [Neptunitalea sp. Y10]GLB50937.1 protein translocase subunit SecE [Neptunitalea sp. Y10]
MAGFVTYIKESYDELKHHVTWPTWAEGQKLMVVVAAFSVIFALAIFGVDKVLEFLMSSFFGLFN